MAAAVELNPHYAPSAVPDRIILTWTDDPATSIAVTWRTDSTVRGPDAEIAEATDSKSIEDGETEAPATTTPVRGDNGLAHHHSVVFRGLKPNTLYAYRVKGGSEARSEWFHVRTASDRPEPFSFIYLGDAQTDIKSHWSRVLRQAYRDLSRARFVVHAGDLVALNPGENHDTDWGEWFEAGGWLHGMVPSIPATGNHEYPPDLRDDGKRLDDLHPGWRAHFTLPEHGPDGLAESVYRVDYQGVRIIVLNSQEALRNGRVADQARWIEPLLADNPNRWTIVVHHHPMVSVARGRDNPALRQHWQPLYDRYGVDLVLQGHDHAYGRGANLSEGTTRQDGGGGSGPMYVVSVAGPKMYELAEGTGWTDRRAKGIQLYQIIHVEPDRLRLEARTATGELYDGFDLIKQSGGGNRLVNRIPDTPERADRTAETGSASR